MAFWHSGKVGGRRVSPGTGRRGGTGGAERGQVLVLVALMMVPLLLFTGLAVDLGRLYVAKGRLQRAVDAAALAASETYHQAGVDTTEKAKQFLATNLLGVNVSDITSFTVNRGSYPDTNQVTVAATERLNTLFMAIVPAFANVSLSARATAILDSYAEIPLHPDLEDAEAGKTGMVNPAVFGPNAPAGLGDAYSTQKLRNGSNNPDYGQLPYGYLFRINVPSTYPSVAGTTQFRIELFDPDCYNMDTPGATGHTNRANTYIDLDFYGEGMHKYYRVDEYRSSTGAENYDTSYATTTQYTLWHFRTDLVNLNPFADPATLSDKAGGGYLARTSYGNVSTSDLQWVSPTGFQLNLNDFSQETADNGGGWNFYLYVQSTAGSSENGFDIRSGPPQGVPAHVNQQSTYNWDTGGSMIFSRRAYPWNNNESKSFIVYLTQVPENAAGTTLLVRHFDNDYDGHTTNYYLQDPDGNDHLVATGTFSGDQGWWASGLSEPDRIEIPARGTSDYDTIFPSGVESAWLKARYDENIAQDTSVWELLYIRPRLLR